MWHAKEVEPATCPPEGRIVVSSEGYGTSLMAGGATKVKTRRSRAQLPEDVDGDLNFVSFNPGLIKLVERTHGGARLF